MSVSRTMFSKAQTRRQSQEFSIMEQYSPLKFDNIPSTSAKEKVSVFRTFRPKQGEVLDYTISETFLEMQHKDTQINYKDTKAEYVPVPEHQLRKLQKRKRIVYSHGAPPQWKFIQEIWLEKQNQLQEIYKEEFKEFLKKRKKDAKYIFANKHALIQSLVGPEWYQELSPRQVEIVDQLHDCIQKDIKNNTIRWTKEAIARLGLVCRPKHAKIELALKNCCGCPVEFLFILYQILNPIRKHYSVNDRLLLSSVVHLTMAQTLRELHIRIPSPIRDKKDQKVRTPRIRKKNYDSPYLVPYTFKPDSPKFEGIYRKKHIQYPDSPYFAYLEFLKTERELAQDYSKLELTGFDELERELIQETIEAQKLFNEMHNTKGSKLLKPTVLKSCSEFEEYKLNIKDRKDKKALTLMEVGIDQTQCTCPSETQIQQEWVTENNKCICKTSSGDPQIPPLSAFCTECSLLRKQKNFNSVIAGVAIIGCEDIVPILGGVYFEFKCSCKLQFEGEIEFLETKKKLQNQRQKYLINGVVITNMGPVYSVSTALCNNRLKKLLKSFMENDSKKKIAKIYSNEEKYVIANNKVKLDDIPEEESVKEQSYGEDHCECNAAKEEVYSTSSEATVEDACHCNRALDIFLKNKCVCEECNVEQRRKDATFIVTGIKQCENKSSPNIVYGIQDRQCNCLENYLDKMKKLEEYRRRYKAVYELKKRGKKYAVTGVTNTEKGPIYQISGTRPPVECICKEVFDEEKQLKEDLRRIPIMPPTGRVKYEIGGVRETSKENVYLIKQALESEECDCELLYKDFMTEHVSCWEAYQHFLKTVEESKMEYLTECKVSDKIGVTENTESNEESGSSFEPSSNFRKSTQNSNENVHKGTLYMSKQTKSDSNCECFEPKLRAGKQKIVKGANKTTRKEVKPEEREIECNCECNKSNSLKFDSSCAIKLYETSYQDQEPKKELKRFIILRKIPRKIRTQRSVLKEALEGMATDGFPLAKLPDAHKLPHFKLWMELRSGQKWKQEDRRYYDLFSQFAWNHTDICYEKIKVPKVDLSPEVEKRTTWNHAAFFRNLTDNIKYNFHRKIKQQLINKTREFFPTIFDYEFPTKQYRKCYFAYLPNKEEDAFVGS